MYQKKVERKTSKSHIFDCFPSILLISPLDGKALICKCSLILNNSVFPLHVSLPQIKAKLFYPMERAVTLCNLQELPFTSLGTPCLNPAQVEEHYLLQTGSTVRGKTPSGACSLKLLHKYKSILLCLTFFPVQCLRFVFIQRCNLKLGILLINSTAPPYNRAKISRTIYYLFITFSGTKGA